jgi:glucosamine--fructose-6-phosphate aminotransferase (isomerizing)
MCGIFAVLGKKNFQEIVLTGLKLLLNRGYDSCGICYIENNFLNTIKHASTNINNSSDLLEKEMLDLKIDSSTAILHTRWSTHGPPTNKNSHPHNDNKNRIALVHNGIIENYLELKEELLSKGYFFISQTDTEVISVLIGYYLDQGNVIGDAIKRTIERLTGTWALTILHKDYPNFMWITRNGSPLLLGFEDDYIIVASEQIAFANNIKRYIILNNNDLIEISKEGDKIKYNKDIHNYKINYKNKIKIELEPTGYKNWLIKEISEQPDCVVRAINNGGRIASNSTVKLGGLDSCQDKLLELNHIILLGCGTSYYSSMWALDIFKTLEIFDTVTIFDGADFDIKDIPRYGKTGLILVSQSGETKDLHRCIQIAKDRNLITIGVVNVIDSMIARETDCGVYLNAGREVSVASTKSFTNQCIILTLIALWFSQNKNNNKNREKREQIIMDLMNLSFDMTQILDESNKIIPSIISNFDVHSIFLLGKGVSHAIALEGALKIKEVSYIHAEGYSSSALKHGPFALIDEGLPIILFDIDEKHREKNDNCYQEVLARGAFVLRISDMNYGDIIINHNKTFAGLLANCVSQILSYNLALLKGLNCDFPKNLAKVVTVD